jgi:hypothetical protein
MILPPIKRTNISQIFQASLKIISSLDTINVSTFYHGKSTLFLIGPVGYALVLSFL